MAEKIMVVDDDMDTLRLVGLMLERQGYQIVAATTGQQALALARSEKPDLVVLDLMMPDMDGLAVARQLRSAPETQGIAIIMFTAKGQTDDKLEGFDAGADDYLTKPTQPRELVAHVRAVLKRAGTRVAAAAPSRQFTESGVMIGVIAVKGGVGVSTIVTNLSISLAQLSKKTIVVGEFRPGCGTIGPELGFNNPVGMEPLLTADPATLTPEVVENALVEHASSVRFLLASSRPQDAAYANAVETFDAIAQNIAYLGRYIVLDLGVGLTPINTKVLARCARILVVIEPVAQTVTQTRNMVEHLGSLGIGEERVVPVLVNRLRAGMQLSLGQVQDIYGRSIPVIFTAAPELAYQSQVALTPMILRQADGITSQQFNALAEKIIKSVR